MSGIAHRPHPSRVALGHRYASQMAVKFATESGLVVPALSETEMREVDRVAVEETGPNLFQMMENAGRSLALTAIEDMDAQVNDPIVVLSGEGGNGGGGITAARHLANHGYQVALAITDQSHLSGVPASQFAVYLGTDGQTIEPAHLSQLKPGLIIDALIGYSLKGPPTGHYADMIGWANAQDAPILSLDLPSGVDATSGETSGVHITANRTLTLALPKWGLGNTAAGSLLLADIGIPEATYRRAGIDIPQRIFGTGFRVGLVRLSTSVSYIEALLTETARNHHEAFLATDGVDPNWTDWYSARVIGGLNQTLGTKMTEIELSQRLEQLSTLHTTSNSTEPWARFYAQGLSGLELDGG